MKESKQAKVIFIQVADNASKLQKLCAIVQRHFENQEAVMILTPSEEAAAYLDQLFWRLPEDSFLPHAMINTPTQTKERITITTIHKNLNQAKILINLCPDIAKHIDEFSLIYELFDRTHPSKEELSRKRHACYLNAGYQVQDGLSHPSISF